MTSQTNPSLSEAVERVSDDECAICGKPRFRHTTNCGVGLCQIYPVFVSKRQMLERLLPDDLRTILQSLSVDEETLARAMEPEAWKALEGERDLIKHKTARSRSLRNARAVLDTMGMANART
jgi:hypothetical protein